MHTRDTRAHHSPYNSFLFIHFAQWATVDNLLFWWTFFCVFLFFVHRARWHIISFNKNANKNSIESEPITECPKSKNTCIDSCLEHNFIHDYCVYTSILFPSEPRASIFDLCSEGRYSYFHQSDSFECL